MKKLVFLLLPCIALAQQLKQVDFISCNAILTPQLEARALTGKVIYTFHVKKDIDSIRIDAKNMTFSEVLVNNKNVLYKNNGKQIVLFQGYKKGKNTVTLVYKAQPKQTLYYTGKEESLQIWTQGQGKYSSHWFPSFDDMNEKVLFNITIKLDCTKEYARKFEVVSNGVLKEKKQEINLSTKENYSVFSFEMQHPMASYLLMLAIGNFKYKTEQSATGITLENYFQPKDSAKYDFTFKDSKTIFDFLEKEIGVPYPWQVYRQIPIKDFLYAGMENTSSTLFDQDFVVDESGWNDRNYCNVNAHELAHQWFGDMITAQSGTHHWLQEGFATYYALLAERALFGEDYFYYALYRNSLLLRKEAKTDTIPILSDKASSYSYYQKGAWALHDIRETIGADNFRKVIQNYLKKYQFKNVQTKDFLDEVLAVVPNFDAQKFQKEWLESYQFPSQRAQDLLLKSDFIKKLFEIQEKKNLNLLSKFHFFQDILQSDASYFLKKEIINQLKNVPFDQKESLVMLAMRSNSIEIRQTVAKTITSIQMSFKNEYETLLEDKSYDTQKEAFLNLWKSFPDSRATYLDKAKNWQGKNDKELRILFLVLFLDYYKKDKDFPMYQYYFKELKSYTGPDYESIVRENAIENILYITPYDRDVLKNLVMGTVHHKWQFVKFSKDTIRTLLKKAEYVSLFTKILPELQADEKEQLNKLLLELSTNTLKN
ncbi:M1 family metallopeptidase [Flavobacterium aciduliphilum]|nr:M1 family metallopeptidase [Flavobacterium aciduliphilum]